MRQTSVKVFCVIACGLLISAAPVRAADGYPPLPSPEEHQKKFSYTRVQPLLDVPMIDAAITRVGDVYYLTGTTGTKRPDGTVNFALNDGIRLWKSADLKSWDPLGLVAPLASVKAKVEDLGLLRTASEADEMKGLLAPELHRIKDSWYLTCGLKPCGTALLKSASGKPEGPYEDLGLITRDGADPSLFADDDGTVYWVFGGGWIAPMNPDMTALAAPPRLVGPTDTRKNLAPGAQILQVGQGGAFLFKKGDTYHLLAAGIHGRLGVPCYDTWVSTAASLDGPWTRRKLAVTHGGQATMFEGPGRQWYATFSGVDSRAALRERAAVVPVTWVGSVGYYYPKNEQWPWKDPDVITEAWGWEHARPIRDLSFRDPLAVNGRDGFFYASGLHNYGSHGRNACMLKGKDLTGDTPWETTPLAGYKTIDDIPWFKQPPGKRHAFLIPFSKVVYEKDTFWITLSVRGGGRVLRSTSGTMAGPWTVTAEPPANVTPRSFYNSIPWQDYDGNLYGRRDSLLWPAKPDFSAPEPDRVPPTEDGYRIPFDKRLGCYLWQSTDGSGLFRGDVPAGHVYKIDGNYLMAGGAGWHGDYRSFGTYDSEVFWSTKPGGPWHPNHSVLPHGGNSGLFPDNDGNWWHISFANDNSLPDGGRLRCLPLEIKWNGNGYDIGPRHKQETPFVHHPPRRLVDQAKLAAAKPAYPLVKLPDDLALRDPSVTPVTEGEKTVYYLTGTAGTKQPDGTIDYRNNDGAYLWKSEDLAQWQPLGRVASLARGKGHLGKENPFHPASYYFSPPDTLEPSYDRGVIAPKLYRIAGDWWIVFSMSRQKVGMLKSTSGKPEGPYELWGPLAGHRTVAFLLDCGIGSENNTDAYLFAYDPSLFVEDDATVYCVFGPGWIAPLSKDLKTLAERPRLLRIEGSRLYAGDGGCRIDKRDGVYRLLARTEWGDVVEATSDALRGPYKNRRIVLPQGGRIGIFRDADGTWKAVGRK
jgi:beta-xylosidase